MLLNKATKIILSLLIMLTFCSACSKKAEEKETATQQSPSQQLSTKIAAMVNESEISTDELNKELTRIQQRFYTSANMSDDQKNQVKKEILNILINNELFYQASQELNISPTEEEIDNGLKVTLEQYPNTDNFTNTFTRDDIKKKLAVEKFISQEFSDKTIISEEQLQSYYSENIEDFTRPEQAFASQILIPVTNQYDEAEKKEALKMITLVQEKLLSGTPFAELADQYNQGTKKMPGGQLGYVVRGQLDPVFEETVFALEPDQVSDIVLTKAGYLILTISEKKPRHVFPLEDISDKLEAFLKQKEIQKKIDNFITNKRVESKIIINL